MGAYLLFYIIYEFLSMSVIINIFQSHGICLELKYTDINIWIVKYLQAWAFNTCEECLYTIVGQWDFLCCLSSTCFICSPRPHLFDQKYSKNVKYYYNFKWPFSILVIYSCDGKAEFTSVFSVTWYSRNDSNMLINCSRSISDYQCWTVIFLWKHDIFFCKLKSSKAFIWLI